MVTAMHRIARAPDGRGFLGDERFLSLEAGIVEAFYDARVEKASQSVANTAWAFAKLGCCNHPLLDAIAAEAMQSLD